MEYIKFNKDAAKRGDPVITRCGYKARILCFDIKDDPFTIAFAYERSPGKEFVDTATDEGKQCYVGESELDLFMAPKVKTFWTNVYKDNGMLCTGGSLFDSKEIALNILDGVALRLEYITTVPIEIEV